MRAKLPEFAEWSKHDVLRSLLGSAEGNFARLQVIRYFASRSKRFARLTGDKPVSIPLRGLAAPLRCSAESGGLAVYYEIVTRGVYRPEAAWGPTSGELVVDAGANIGVFTLWAANQVGEHGRVIGFEPHPVAFGVLKSNTETLPQVVVHELALGDEPARLTLRYPPGRLSISSFDERPDRTSSVDVDVVTLDSALADVPGDIAFLKIDVEGFEEQVLRGAMATMRRTHRLALEIAGNDLDPCVTIAAEAGLGLKSTFSGMWNLPARLGLIAYFEPAPY